MDAVHILQDPKLIVHTVSRALDGRQMPGKASLCIIAGTKNT